MPTYSIIIGTKDRLQSLEKLIYSIEPYTKDYELIIVSDASTDGTNEWLKKQHIRHGVSPRDIPYQAISYTTSLPVATAWNLGCEVAKGEFIQILNDDMEVTEGWLERQRELYDYLTNSGRKVGVLAAKLLRGDEILSRGGAFRGTQLVPVPPPEEIKQVSYSNTPFFKRTLFKELGGFKAYAQMYYEDAGWGLRCMRAGYTNYYNPSSVIKHETLGFSVKDGEEQIKRRRHNEQVVQQQAREEFMKEWGEWLKNEHENIY